MSKDFQDTSGPYELSTPGVGHRENTNNAAGTGASNDDPGPRSRSRTSSRLLLQLLRTCELGSWSPLRTETSATGKRGSAAKTQTSRYAGPLVHRSSALVFNTNTDPFVTSRSHVASDLALAVAVDLTLPQRPEKALVKQHRQPQLTPDADSTLNTVSPAACAFDNCGFLITEPPPRAQSQHNTMGLSKTQRISILLAIDGVFFLVEIVVGYAVHSLALVADSFHMLNDVLSLCVGLWAVRVANTGSSEMYTYGWQRAETLGALFNGVFLIALCLSIFLEAIQRLVEPQIVTNPKLVLIVGCLGLLSNILGLFLFHDHGHGHSHGHEHDEHGHTHSYDAVKNAEEGRGHADTHTHAADERSRLIGNEGGSIADVLPTVQVAGYQPHAKKRSFTKSDESNTTAPSAAASPAKRRSISGAESPTRHRRRTSVFGGSFDNVPVHPIDRRTGFIYGSQMEEVRSEGSAEEEEALVSDAEPPNGQVVNGNTTSYGSIQRPKMPEYSHESHIHRQPASKKRKSGGGHGHSHGDMNMRGVFLHVLGDALGNIGVIGSALIIWLTTWSGRYYCDPAISLIITVIILYSAIPLCRAASRILLQAVPMGMSIDEITADIKSLEGVDSTHDLHVWQLSDTKLVASLHVKVQSNIKGQGSAGYMRLAREIQQCLREYGVSQSTIQPEFMQGTEHEDSEAHDHDHSDGHNQSQDHEHDHGSSSNHTSESGQNSQPASSSPKIGNGKSASLRSKASDNRVCMMDCDDLNAKQQIQQQAHPSHDGHDHSHGNGSNNSQGKK